MLNTFAKFFIMLGVFFLCLGVFFYLINKIPGMGNLPGDISIKREHFSFQFPVFSCIVMSIVLTILLNIILFFFNRSH